MSDAPPRFLVTGAYGCIGAWVVRELLARGLRAVTFDRASDPARLHLVSGADEAAGLPDVQGDIADGGAVGEAIDRHEVAGVIHLAALQVPFCRADPPLGARVNVVGMANVLEAVARRRDRLRPLVYASSIAVYAPGQDGGAPDPTAGWPGTAYGVYKRADEGLARIYGAERGVASVGLRPHTVFGPGRDQGLTSQPTAAMLAAAAGRPYRIGYGGRLQMQYAPDVARAFVQAALAPVAGAAVHNLAGAAVDMGDVVAAIEAAAPEAAGSVTYAGDPLPFPGAVDAGSIAGAIGAVEETPFADAVAETVARFRELLADGLVAADGDGAAPVAR